MKTAEQLDSEDALRFLREYYDLPSDRTYLDGNSLGALSHAVKEQLRDVTENQWGTDLIDG